MAALATDYMALLERALAKDFVPHLAPMLDTTKPADERAKKSFRVRSALSR